MRENKKIKILYIIPSFDSGGAEKMLADLIDRLDRERFEPVLVCLRRRGYWAEQLEKRGVPVFLLGSKPKLEFLSFFKIRKIIKELGPDIVHTHLFGADVYGGLAAFSCGVRNIIATEHNLNFSESFFKKTLKRLAYKKFSSVFAVSKSVREYARKAYRLNKSQLGLIYNGVDFDYFADKKDRVFSNKKSFAIGSVGRLAKQKGFETLLEAALILKNENISFKIAGGGRDKKELSAFIKKNGLDDSVKLVGTQKDIKDFYNSLDLYVQPSLWEGLGIAALEAGASGLPVLASRVDGLTEIISQEKEGLFFEPGDARDLAQKIKSFLNDPDLAKKMVENLREKIRNNFSLDSMVRSYEDIYTSACSCRNILLINKFHYLRGGAERSYFDTADILRENGHNVAFFSMQHPGNEKTYWEKYFIKNTEYNNESTAFSDKLRAVFNIWYNFSANKKLSQLLKEFRPDIAHLHNIYHQISPSIINVLKKNNIPIAYTLHDYKLISPNYSLMLRGEIWEKTKPKKYYKCFSEKCVKDSYAKSLVCVLEAYLHNALGLYRKVDAYISPSHFLADKFREFGFKNEISYLPNPLPFAGRQENEPGDYFLYYGRLSPEKGVLDLLCAYHKSAQEKNLYIIGEGEEKKSLEEFIVKNELEEKVFLLGFKSGQELIDYIRDARAIIIPSRWYENAPYTVIEAMAEAKVVLASNIGGLAEMIQNGQNGFLFPFADRKALQEQLDYLSGLDDDKLKNIGLSAQGLVREKNSRENYYKKLLKIYKKASKNR